jgi:hypothetical protein
VAVRLQLRVNQPPVHAHLEAATIGRDERQRFDIGLELFQQFSRQTGGAIGVVSGGTVNQLDSDGHRSRSPWNSRILPAG